MKVCTKCKEEKELIEFSWRNDQNKYRADCKVCATKQKNKYRLNNKERFKEYDKIYFLKNADKRRAYSREYNKNNREKRNEYNKIYQKNKKLNNPLYKLRCNIRNLIGSSISNRGYTKKSKTYEYLGCSFEEFKIHIERQFTKGMTWQNAGEWHLDHIYPVSLAKDEKELIRLNHYTNFQPLWAADNLSKGNKIIEKQLILI